ncbi:MAG: hypothetical protein ACREXP_09520 [Steroidobacteraceae bacterium]
MIDEGKVAWARAYGLRDTATRRRPQSRHSFRRVRSASPSLPWARCDSSRRAGCHWTMTSTRS